MLSNSDIITEGLTDSSGVFLFETSKKDEYLTIVANKQGFFIGQRTFVKDQSIKNNTQISEKNEQTVSAEKASSLDSQSDVQKDIVIVLVRENLVMMEKSILFITYSNSFADNFEPLFLYSDKCIIVDNIVSDLLEIQCSNLQKDIGILTTQFKCIIKYKS